jgi:hypothetical protein
VFEAIYMPSKDEITVLFGLTPRISHELHETSKLKAVRETWNRLKIKTVRFPSDKNKPVQSKK